jgi:hypothetical protein
MRVFMVPARCAERETLSRIATRICRRASPTLGPGMRPGFSARGCVWRRKDLLSWGIACGHALHQPLPGLLLRGTRGLANRNLQIGDLPFDLVTR